MRTIIVILFLLLSVSAIADQSADIWAGNYSGLTQIERHLMDGKRLEFRGVRVVAHDELIDPNQADNKGRGNCLRMGKGAAPVDTQREPVHLHHMLQDNEGIIVEINDDDHRLFYKDLHHYRTVSEINRAKFDSWKRHYWKHRAGMLCHVYR
ncbi:MAG: hypothetical protein HQL58_09640 [Magnetococcales bacterium]|nr:hypothetical protein [Magnetococcales bacterium]